MGVDLRSRCADVPTQLAPLAQLVGGMTLRASVAGDSAAWLADHAHWVGPDGIPHRLLEHVEYSVLTVALSALVAVPLGLWIGHTGRLRGVAVAATGALRALPTLGLLTWFVLIAGIGLTAPTAALVILADRKSVV